MLRYEIHSKEKILICSSHCKHRSLQRCSYSRQILFSLFKQLLHISLHYKSKLKANRERGEQELSVQSLQYQEVSLDVGNLTSVFTESFHRGHVTQLCT